MGGSRVGSRAASSCWGEGSFSLAVLGRVSEVFGFIGWELEVIHSDLRNVWSQKKASERNIPCCLLGGIKRVISVTAHFQLHKWANPMAGLTVSNNAGSDGRCHGNVMCHSGKTHGKTTRMELFRVNFPMNFQLATLGSGGHGGIQPLTTDIADIATATCLPRVFSYEDQETVKVGRALRQARSSVDQ